MKQKAWVLLPLACVLLIFCAARVVRRPAASDGAQRIEVCESLAQADAKETDARFQQATESIDTDNVQAAHELQRRQQEATRPLSENPRLVS